MQANLQDGLDELLGRLFWLAVAVAAYREVGAVKGMSRRAEKCSGAGREAV
jgi:hypothetical protein